MLIYIPHVKHPMVVHHPTWRLVRSRQRIELVDYIVQNRRVDRYHLLVTSQLRTPAIEIR